MGEHWWNDSDVESSDYRTTGDVFVGDLFADDGDFDFLNFSFLLSNFGGGIDATGDPWFLSGTDFEIDRDLKVNNTEVENDLIVNGRIGIGTPLPSSELHVIGNANITNGIVIPNITAEDGTLEIIGDVNLSDKVLIAGTPAGVGGVRVSFIFPNQQLDGTHPRAFLQYSFFGDDRGGWVGDAMRLYLGATNVVGTTIYSFYPLLAAGSNSFDLGTDDNRWRNLYLSSNITMDGSLTTSGNASIGGVTIDGTNTRIGIGVTPTKALHVIGDAIITGIIKADELNGSKLNISGNAFIGGNVGIGTSTPSESLDVIGDFIVQTSPLTNIRTNGTWTSGIVTYPILTGQSWLGAPINIAADGTFVVDSGLFLVDPEGVNDGFINIVSKTGISKTLDIRYDEASDGRAEIISTGGDLYIGTSGDGDIILNTSTSQTKVLGNLNVTGTEEINSGIGTHAPLELFGADAKNSQLRMGFFKEPTGGVNL